MIPVVEPTPIVPRPVALLLTNDTKRRAKRFHEAAEWFSMHAEVPWARFHEVTDLEDMIQPASRYPVNSVSQLAVFGHGVPEGFGRPGRFGVDTRRARYEKKATFASTHTWASDWAPALVDGALVSLCCCLCSRDPKWYRTTLLARFGIDPSEWGPGAFSDGGLHSVAAVLARSFAAVGREVVVRGHCAAGDTIHQALLREHSMADGDAIGRSLYQKAHPGNIPDRAQRQAWHARVKGEISARWLLGIDSTEETLDLVKE